MLRVALVIDDYNELIYLQTILRKIGFDVEGLQNVKKYSELSLGFNPQVLIASAFGKKVNGLEFASTLHRVRGLPKIILLQTPEQPVPKPDIAALNIDLVLDSPVNPTALITGLASVANVDEAALHEKFKRLQASGGLGLPEEFQLTGEDEPKVRETPRFAFRDQGQNHEPAAGSKLKIKPEEPSVIVPKPGQDPKTAFSVAELRAQSLENAASAPAKTPTTASGHPVQTSHPAISQTPYEQQMRQERFKHFVAEAEPIDPKASFDRDRIMQFNKKIRAAPAPEDIEQIEADRKEFVKNLFVKGKPR